jgi:periplasmic protein TonB
MDNNSHYFYISGLISFLFFIAIFLLFVFVLFDVKKVNTYALKKDTYMSISLEMPVVQKKKSQQKVQSTPVESTSEVESEDIDINDLFSDVWTKKIAKKEKKPVNSKRLQEIQKKIKKSESKSVKSIAEKVNNLDKIESNKEQQSASTANEVNEYLAKIQAIVYQYFNVPPNSQGNSIKTVIELNALGKVLDFRVLTYSQNSALNDEADKIKERLKNVVFPINPKNRSSKTVVILIAKE